MAGTLIAHKAFYLRERNRRKDEENHKTLELPSREIVFAFFSFVLEF
jgi:hypothetical protein